MSKLVLGIDLGTTNSAVALYIKEELKVLENCEGDNTTPSYVYFINNEGITVGKNAKLQSARVPEHGIFDIKRFMGRQYYQIEQYLRDLPFRVVNREQGPYVYLEKFKTYKSPQEISSYILKKLKNDASSKVGKSITKAVITVPAHFNVAQRRATLEAAKEAGFEVIKLLNEPTAAALNYYFENKDIMPVKKISLVYDLGGGTFDVAVLERNGQNIDVLSIDGDSHLGGRDFDDIIKDYVIEQLRNSYKINGKLQSRDVRRVMNHCVTAKESLSTEPFTSIILEGFFKRDVIEIELRREKFEEMAMHLFKKTISIMDKCITSVGLTKNSIDEIILAGGSTRIPKIQELLTEYFSGKPLNKILHPEECVAKGAALQAAMLSQSERQKVKHFVVTEVTSSSLGVGDVVNRMDVIIKKNTKLPTTKAVTHATVQNEQKAINLKIYEGERMFVKRNVCLGDFKITGLTPAPPGKCKIDITMSIDLNGILTVTAKETLTKNTKDLQIAYSKVNRALEKNEPINEVELEIEEKHFAEYAKIQEFLLTYVAAIDYNFKHKAIAAVDMDVLQKSKQTQKKIMEMEDVHDISQIMGLGKMLLKFCSPVIRKYKFKDVPISREIERQLENFNAPSDVCDDYEDERYFGTRKVESKRRFLF